MPGKASRGGHRAFVDPRRGALRDPHRDPHGLRPTRHEVERIPERRQRIGIGDILLPAGDILDFEERGLQAAIRASQVGDGHRHAPDRLARKQDELAALDFVPRGRQFPPERGLGLGALIPHDLDRARGEPDGNVGEGGGTADGRERYRRHETEPVHASPPVNIPPPKRDFQSG